MKKADKEKEEKFVEQFVVSGNAKQSCIKAGYKESTAIQMGYYLRKKFINEIEEKQRDRLNSMNGIAIGVLQDLLTSQQDSVRLNTCKLILECNGISGDTNMNIRFKDKDSGKTDEELVDELANLYKELPELKEKLLKKIN